MTRPKVHPDQRQRTAQACDSCKRRKQKCNGLCPCVTCEKRNLSCTYGSSDYGSDEASPSKKRLVEPDAAITHALSAKLIGSSYPRTQTNSPRTPKPQGAPWGYSEEANAFGEALQSHDNVKEEPNRPSTQATNRPNELVSISREQKPTAMSRGTTLSGNDEEAVVYTAPRMLQDSTGRLLYLGDSATLSYLQLIRMIVENVTGPSPFTTDPRRHRIMENSFTLPPGLRYTHVLPDRITADVLLDSFFANTSGLLHVFDEVSFRTSVEECYNDPLATDPSWLCLLNLTFAVGLVLATPRPGTNDEAVIEHLRNGSLDRAEVFFMNAKSLNDPVTGFEDAGFWSIQALLLMTTYMLTVSKRNAAFAYFGMAVRSAFALGIHREETMVIYSIEDQQERRNLWRSLFVFDRFLSASLGRPVAISESDCSGDTLTPPEEPTFPMAADVNQSNLLGLEATVRSCHAIGIILKRVYQKRRISTKIAQDIADICKRWPNGLAPVLNWQHALGAVPRQAVAILHANLFYCHSIILLTRPFFLFLLNAKVQKGRPSTTIPLQRPGGRMEKFAAACVTASSHSVELCLNAFQGGCLQRRNPFVIYFLFTSALVLLSSEFSSPSATPPETITKAITIMAYCAEADPQANRLLYILSTFRDVVNSRYLNRNHQLAGGDPNTAIFKEADESAIFTPAGGLQASLTSPRAEVERPSIGSQNLGPVVQQRRKGSFGVDLQSIGNSLTVGSDESSNGDEAFDFETFWNWPANTPVNEEIREGIVDSRNEQGNINNGSAVNEASVPLFGMVDIQ